MFFATVFCPTTLTRVILRRIAARTNAFTERYPGPRVPPGMTLDNRKYRRLARLLCLDDTISEGPGQAYSSLMLVIHESFWFAVSVALKAKMQSTLLKRLLEEQHGQQVSSSVS